MASATQHPPQSARWPSRNPNFGQPSPLNPSNRARPSSQDGQQSSPSPRLQKQHRSHDNNSEHSLPPVPQEHERTHSRTHSIFSSFRKHSISQPSTGPAPRSPPGEFGNNTSPKSRIIDSPPAQSQHSPPSDGPPQPARRPSGASSQPPPPLHPEIRSVVSLQAAHASKVYCAGNLIRRLERLPDGQRPAKDEGWTDVFAQLGGTTLSVWDMNAVNEAAKIGAQVPPSYINVTDAFIQVLGSVTVPATESTPAKKYMNVITLNTAGANLLLFACPDTYSLISWASALRLSAYEKSRLEEIYTAHILRLSFNVEGSWKEPATRLVRGKLEGQVKVRIAGKTEWRPVWAIVCAATSGGGSRIGVAEDGRPQSPTNTGSVTKRVSALFNRSPSDANVNAASPQTATITFYLSQKGKDRKKPLLTIRNVTQAFAVYPERPELINHSTLIKIEGVIGDEDTAGALKSREGWIYIVPEMVEPGRSGLKEMLKWTTAIHDAFGLYGRDPIHQGYTWDPRDHLSMMFAYPVGPLKDKLFLDPVLAENLDPREDRTSAIRATLTNTCLERMGPTGIPNSGSSPPQRPSGESNVTSSEVESETSAPGPNGGPQEQGSQGINQRSTSPPAAAGQSTLPQLDLLPPLDFTGATESPPDNRRKGPMRAPFSQNDISLSPISERTTVDSSKGYFGEDLSRFNSVSQSNTEGSLPPARSTRNDSGVLPRIQTAPSRSATTTSSPSVYSAEQKSSGESKPNLGMITERDFSSSPVDEMEPPLPTPRPPTEESSKERQSFGSFSVISGRAGSPTATAVGGSGGQPVSGSARSSFDGVKVGSPMRAQSPPNSARSPLNPSVYAQAQAQAQGRQSPAIGPASVDSEYRRPMPIPPVAGSPPARNSPQTTSPPISTGAPSQSSSPGLRKPTGVTLRDDQFSRPGPERTSPRPPSTTVARDVPDSNANTLQFPSKSNAVPQRPPVQLPIGGGGRSDTSEESPEQEEEEDDEENEYHQKPTIVPVTAVSPAPRKRQGTPMFDGHPSPVADPEIDLVPSTSASAAATTAGLADSGKLGRRPSGARAPPTKRATSSDTSSIQLHSIPNQMPNSFDDEVDNSADVLAALSFLQQEEETVPPLSVTKRAAATATASSPRAPMPIIEEPEDRAPSPPEPQYRSSFAPSKKAVERKARSQAAQAASQASVLKPGRPANGGAGKLKKDRGAWESSEEEDDEDEEDDDDEGVEDSSAAPQIGPRFRQGEIPIGEGQPTRPARLLPQIPGSRSASDSHSARGESELGLGGPPRPSYYDQQSDPRMRQSSFGSDRLHQPQPEYAHQVPPARQALWSTVLDPKNGNGPQPNARDTFVDLNEDSHVMTKAFQPQGLLSVGLQDKQDRSAKRQEELARESGASLVNVPAKPPPPQTGLLGAITGYERERKREGGVGAALTERERDRRLAENRQRKLDDFQRLQLDQQQQMAQGGGNAYSMYGNPYMSMAPNPMMMGGYGAFPGMMGGFTNPQQMFAAQQAAQAYQQAMMSYSTAGSQIGGENNATPPNQSPPPGMGMMTPGGGFDPRMSMMGMGMMPMMGGGMPGWDPRMSMYSPAPGMEYNNPMMMQSPGLMPQHTGMTSPPSMYGPPLPPFSGLGRSATPPSRGSANQSPQPPPPPPPALANPPGPPPQ